MNQTKLVLVIIFFLATPASRIAGSDADNSRHSPGIKAIASLSHAGIHLPAGVSSMAFMPRGRFLFMGCEDGKVTIWDIPEKKPAANFMTDDSVTSIEAPSMGHLFALADGNGKISLRDQESFQEACSMKLKGPISNIAFSEEGRLLACVDGTRRVHVWDISQDKPQPLSSTEPMDGQAIKPIVSFIPPASYSATAACLSQGEVTFRAMTGAQGFQFPPRAVVRETGALVPYPGYEKVKVLDLFFSPDNSMCAFFCTENPTSKKSFDTALQPGDPKDHSFRIWDFKSDKEIKKIEVPAKNPMYRFTAGGKKLFILDASIQQDGDPPLSESWGSPGRKEAKSSKARESDSKGKRKGRSDASPQKFQANTGSVPSCSVILSDLSSDQLLTQRAHANWQRISAAAISPEGGSFAASGAGGAWDRTVQIWKGLETGKISLDSPPIHLGAVKGLVFSPDVRFLCSFHESRKVVVWALKEGAVKNIFQTPVDLLTPISDPGSLSAPEFMAWTERGTTGKVGILDFWGRSVFQFDTEVKNRISQISFSPDRKKAALTQDDGITFLRDIQSSGQAKMIPLEGGRGTPVTVTGFGGSPQKLIRGLEDGRIEFLYPATGKLEASLKVSKNGVFRFFITKYEVIVMDKKGAVAFVGLNSRIISKQIQGMIEENDAARKLHSIIQSEDIKFLGLVTNQKELEIWSLGTAKPTVLDRSSLEKAVASAVLSEGGLFIALGYQDGTIDVLSR